jgi:hypothetical protein
MMYERRMEPSDTISNHKIKNYLRRTLLRCCSNVLTKNAKKFNEPVELIAGINNEPTSNYMEGYKVNGGIRGEGWWVNGITN